MVPALPPFASPAMNYVGQLAGTVFGTMKELYQGLNPATLSGCIDVLVVKQVDGSFRCSPFHVRFGKLGVLRSREKVVDIEINGEPVDLHMKLGDSGEAFFVQELESDEPLIFSTGKRASPPMHVTLTLGRPVGFPSDSQLGTASESEPIILGVASTGRKKRLRRRKPRWKEDTVADDSSSEELEAGAESELSLLEKPRLEPTGCVETSSIQLAEESSSQPTDIYPYSDGEWPSQTSLSSGELTSPKSDSELEVRTPEPSPLRAESHMQWAWGRLPKVAKAERPMSSVVPDGSTEAASAQGEPSTPDLPPDRRGPLWWVPLSLPPREKNPRLRDPRMRVSLLPQNHGAGPLWRVRLPPGHQRGSPGGKQMASPLPSGSLKRSQPLGPIYLDDLSSWTLRTQPFTSPRGAWVLGARAWDQNCDCGLGPRRWSEPGGQKPMGDPNPEQEAEPTPDTVDTIVLSLCGGLADSRDISLEKFNKHIVSYQDLVQNPGLLDDPNLVVKINEKHYNWAVAAPMVLSLQAFQKNLPKSTVDKLEKEKMPRKGGRWWFSWRRKDFPAEERSAPREKTTAREARGEKMDVLSSEDDAPDSPVILEAPSLPPLPPAYTPAYKKSLRLSSDQIRQLNLQEGANDVVFSVTTQYQGTCRCRATIYLWKWDDKVVISDIDGTITKSDALGHILPQLGKDWTHQGITSLYHKIHLNGYKFLYCSARAIGMADLTKGYLQWVSERGCGLPKGPILLSPSSLFSALHREVIEKKPEVFKIACLSDIQQLFLPHGQPFYAAFGNRPNDVTAYRHVGLPESRIFTVNPRGELIQEPMKNHKSTYKRLSEVVELLFPPLDRGPSTDLANPEYSSFCYWREPLTTVDLDTLA
ncbi:hypothetical protein QTO34_002372 [Cnephaeus nilssonii]|uniref:phosphatidate phosphatase n=1 Tax=Cnephaeus nilssonii TaxID=3371016 RepID=A0AA40LNB7_CNENI|nr:hypothetical protein QTO34_002372 [Eptesicus nilssonii]